jgi:hypothetical protein
MGARALAGAHDRTKAILTWQHPIAAIHTRPSVMAPEWWCAWEPPLPDEPRAIMGPWR